MTITLCNGKGGSGKTTLSVLLGCALAEAGHRLGLLDTDSQHTATRWIEEIGGLELAASGKEYDALSLIQHPGLNPRKSLIQSDVQMSWSS